MNDEQIKFARDKMRKNIVPGLSMSYIEEWIAKLETERDEAIAHGERMRKATIAAEKQLPEIKRYRGLWEGTIEERDELRAEVESLKADKARLDWIEELDPDSRVWFKIADAISIRDAIDAAMKGDK